MKAPKKQLPGHAAPAPQSLPEKLTLKGFATEAEERDHAAEVLKKQPEQLRQLADRYKSHKIAPDLSVAERGLTVAALTIMAQLLEVKQTQRPSGKRGNPNFTPEVYDPGQIELQVALEMLRQKDAGERVSALKARDVIAVRHGISEPTVRRYCGDRAHLERVMALFDRP